MACFLSYFPHSHTAIPRQTVVQRRRRRCRLSRQFSFPLLPLPNQHPSIHQKALDFQAGEKHHPGWLVSVTRVTKDETLMRSSVRMFLLGRPKKVGRYNQLTNNITSGSKMQAESGLSNDPRNGENDEIYPQHSRALGANYAFDRSVPCAVPGPFVPSLEEILTTCMATGGPRAVVDSPAHPCEIYVQFICV